MFFIHVSFVLGFDLNLYVQYEWMNEWIFIQHCQVQSHQQHNFVHDKSQWSNIVLLELRIAQMIKTMLKGNAGSLNKTYEVAFPSRLHTINCYNYIHCYMIFFYIHWLHTLLYDFFIYTLITYIGTIHVVYKQATTRQYLKNSKIINMMSVYDECLWWVFIE